MSTSHSQTQRVLHAGDEYEGVEMADRSSETRSSEVLPVVARLDEQKVIRTADRTLLGFNNNWHFSNELLLRDNKLREDYLELFRGQRLSLMRMSGTASQYYQWKKAIGPMDERLPMRARSQDRPSVFGLGPLEWVDSFLQVDPEGQVSWTLNLTKDSAQDHADLARLFTADASDEWGAKRVEFGYEEPFSIFVWQLGNELDWGVHEELFPIDRYIEVSREAIQAVRAVHPEARFGANAATAPWSPRYRERPGSWKDWHRKVLEELGDEIDYISIHPYYFGLRIVELEKYIDALRDDIVSITGSDRIKIYISEHARWPARPTEPGVQWRENWYQTHSLEGCLATAEFLTRMLDRPEIVACAYHNFSGGPWRIFSEDEVTGELFTTGIFHLFEFLHSVWEGEVISLELTGARTSLTDRERDFIGAAIQNGETLSLLLVNRGNATRSLTLESVNDWKAIKQRVFTAPHLDAINTVEEMVFSISEEALDDVSVENLHLSPHSITIIELKR